MGPGIPGVFIAFFVVIVVLGIASTVWRISVSRRIARDAGLDPDTAAAVTMLSNDGIDAAYLASTLSRSSRPQSQQATPAQRTVEQRLQELQALQAKGLITQTEYDARRREVLDSI
jgi:hypothetical protein